MMKVHKKAPAFFEQFIMIAEVKSIQFTIWNDFYMGCLNKIEMYKYAKYYAYRCINAKYVKMNIHGDIHRNIQKLMLD